MTLRYNFGQQQERKSFNFSKCNTELSSIQSTHWGADHGVEIARHECKNWVNGMQSVTESKVQWYSLLLRGAESCELALMGLMHCALSQHECVTLRTAANRSAFGNLIEPWQWGSGHRLYCAVSSEPHITMGTCSKLACVQRYITCQSPSCNPPYWLIGSFLLQITFSSLWTRKNETEFEREKESDH